jgi:diadenosine tetraphosphate (Ap4A) HIT family hydrolase
MSEECTFCDLEGFRICSVLFLENALCLFANSDGDDLLRGSGVIVPKAHRPTVFDLTREEFEATFDLLRLARPLLDERYRPDGFNVGWNCYAAGGQRVAHAHLHVLLRYADEPKAGTGIRHALAQADNRRPDPTAPGHLQRVFLASD